MAMRNNTPTVIDLAEPDLNITLASAYRFMASQVAHDPGFSRQRNHLKKSGMWGEDLAAMTRVVTDPARLPLPGFPEN
jgi:hypothetical protein